MDERGSSTMLILNEMIGDPRYDHESSNPSDNHRSNEVIQFA